MSWLTAGAFSLLFAVPQQPPSLQDLRDLLAPIRERHDVPALGAAVLVDGELTALGTTGLRRRGREEAVTDDDLWHLGSCTKAMTATLLARQVAAGHVRWDTTVAEGLPGLADAFDPAAAKITVRHLLTHRAGLPGGPPPALWSELFRYEGTTRQARLDVAGALLGAAPEAPLGERYLYSNASYMIAGAIAEHAQGAPWEQLMRSQLFEPLGMASAGFGPPGSKDDASQPWGHRAKTKQAVFADNPPSLGPAGTVHCTLRDWAKFAQLHLGASRRDAGPLLATQQLSTLHEPAFGGDYALGWVVTRRAWAKGPILTHSGSNTMWFCVAWLAPEAKFGVLVTCNQGDAGKACDEVAAACIGRFAGKGR